MPDPNQSLERIERAAIWHRGRVYSVARPGRHHDVIRSMADAGFGPEAMSHQGFVTDAGRFVDRREAMQIAVAADQLIPLEQDGVPMKRTSPVLYSEDVW
jgi:hypothetical protein